MNTRSHHNVHKIQILGVKIHNHPIVRGKGKAVPIRVWSVPEGSRKLRFPDFLTTIQAGGMVVSLTHRPHLPQETLPVLISVRG
jgi:hypothetical protein